MNDFCEVCGCSLDDLTYIDSYTREPICWSCKHDTDCTTEYDEEDRMIESLWHDSVDDIITSMDEDEVLTHIAENK